MKKLKRGRGNRGQPRGTPSAQVAKKRERKNQDRTRGSPRALESEAFPASVPLLDLTPLLEVWGIRTPKTPVNVADDLVDQALKCKSKARREALAHRALQLSPDCTKAYLLLAREASWPEGTQLLLKQAVAAEERVLGPKFFSEEVGNFWMLLETRQYMRARELLAGCLWALNERQEACAHYEDLLRLNPNENQGIRYLLAGSLLEMEEHESLTRLLTTYAEDASAAWAYTSALLVFRQKGPKTALAKNLDKAFKCNPFVPDYLLGRKSLPKQLPEFIARGAESEAWEYVSVNKFAWTQTPGALEWLDSALDGWVLPPTPVSIETGETGESADSAADT